MAQAGRFVLDYRVYRASASLWRSRRYQPTLENRIGSCGPFFEVIDLIETKMRNRFGSCGAGCY